MKPLLLLVTVAVPFAAQAAGETPNALNYSGAAWSPYIVGAGIGLLVLMTLYFSKKPVGASSAYASAAGLIGKAIAPRHTANLKYYKDNPPCVDWELIFVGAAIVGAFLAARQGGELTLRWLPPMWVDRFGESSLWLRGIVAVLGGVLMSFGARMAGGCTSGHGISGTAQLNVASWIAVVCFFFGGAIVANLMFRL
jgi:uncharacterized membrane protein YedE/YeeE